MIRGADAQRCVLIDSNPIVRRVTRVFIGHMAELGNVRMSIAHGIELEISSTVEDMIRHAHRHAPVAETEIQQVAK